ncbi:MAG: hypothetical protein OK455_09450 [Thaumarchaeota archaeon]|nr:hypothetical protein [Nitrososphaerota archaeon]
MSAGTCAFLFLLSFGVAPAHAATTYTLTVQTDKTSYSGAQPIMITGTISPPPGPNTGVIITVRNPTGSMADINEVIPGPANGSFSDISVPGGSASWVSGMYTINATWGGGGTSASNVATFVYLPTAASTTTTSTSTTTTTTTTSTTTSSSTTTSTSTSSSASTSTSSSTTTSTTSTTSSTSTSTSSTVPEFPSSVLAALALIGMATVAVFSRRMTLRPATYGGS